MSRLDKRTNPKNTGSDGVEARREERKQTALEKTKQYDNDMRHYNRMKKIQEPGTTLYSPGKEQVCTLYMPDALYEAYQQEIPADSPWLNMDIEDLRQAVLEKNAQLVADQLAQGQYPVQGYVENYEKEDPDETEEGEYDPAIWQYGETKDSEQDVPCEEEV